MRNAPLGLWNCALVVSVAIRDIQLFQHKEKHYYRTSATSTLPFIGVRKEWDEFRGRWQ